MAMKLEIKVTPLWKKLHVFRQTGQTMHVACLFMKKGLLYFAGEFNGGSTLLIVKNVVQSGSSRQADFNVCGQSQYTITFCRRADTSKLVSVQEVRN